MYIDVNLDKYSKNFRITIYRNNFAERITSNSMRIVAEHIRNILRNNDEILYIDNHSYGKSLTDCLDSIGVQYKPLKNVSLNLIQDGE
ncbi:MAG: hypothetical protein K1W16_13825 [Lachnospiraceae bacterium]